MIMIIKEQIYVFVQIEPKFPAFLVTEVEAKIGSMIKGDAF